MDHVFALRRLSLRAAAGLALAGLAASAQALLPGAATFVENLGQWPDEVRFHMLVGATREGPASRADIWLTPEGYRYQVSEQTTTEASAERREHTVAVTFVGANPLRTVGESPAPGVFNWLVGDDESRFVRGARAFRQVRYEQAYPGIDVLFDVATATRMLETTFVVEPGASPSAIALRYDGAARLDVDAAGNLLVGTTLGEITELAPIAFQAGADGLREEVAVRFRLDADRLGFELGDYDRRRTLWIDPVVSFSRSFGGSSADYVAEMHEDGTGRYLTGYTTSSDFPTTPGASDPTAASTDLFAAKFDLANETLLWATYIGGNGTEFGGNSTLAGDGSLYLVTSTTSGASWPALSTFGAVGSYDVGVFHLSADGSSRLGCLILGSAAGTDSAADVELAGNGDVVVSGATNNGAFPTVAGFDTSFDGGLEAFVARFNGTLDSYLDFTYVPGTPGSEGASGTAFDAAGNIYVYGFTTDATSYPATATIGPGGNYDLIVAKYDAGLDAQAYNVVIGGSSTDPHAGYSYTSALYYNIANSAILVDGSNRAWVTGMAASSDFPTTPGAYQTTNAGNYDVFVLALNAAGSALDYSTLIGGSSTDTGKALAFDDEGNVHVVGATASSNYPTASSPQPHAGGYDMLYSVLSPDLGTLISSSLWGSGGSDFATDLAVGPDQTARVAGFGIGIPQWPMGAPVFGPGGNFDGVVVAFGLVLADPLQEIPTLDGAGLVVLVALLALAGLVGLRRRVGSGASG